MKKYFFIASIVFAIIIIGISSQEAFAGEITYQIIGNTVDMQRTLVFEVVIDDTDLNPDEPVVGHFQIGSYRIISYTGNFDGIPILPPSQNPSQGH